MGRKYDFEVCAGRQVSESELLRFYQLAFPHRAGATKEYWDWQYQGISQMNLEKWPMVAIDQSGQIIGHVATVPVGVIHDGTLLEAAWFMDFYVVASARGRGVGKCLMERVMTRAPVMMAIGASRDSIPMFRSYGWYEDTSVYQHSFITRPSQLPTVKKYLGAGFTDVVDRSLAGYLETSLSGGSNLSVRPISNSVDLEHLFGRITNNSLRGSKTTVIKRDIEYFDWRVGQNCAGGRFEVFATGEAHALVRTLWIHGRAESKILMVSGQNIRQLVSGIIGHVVKAGVSRVSLLSSNRSNFEIPLKRIWIKKKTAPFIFSKDRDLLNDLTNNPLSLGLIDSDLDSSQIGSTSAPP